MLALSRRRQLVRIEVGWEEQLRRQHAGWRLDSQHQRNTNSCECLVQVLSCEQERPLPRCWVFASSQGQSQRWLRVWRRCILGTSLATTASSSPGGAFFVV